MKELDRQIVAISVPAFAALISEPLMLIADTIIVGHLGRQELAALAAASTVLGTIVGLCIFLAYGSTATVARYHGAGSERRALELAVSGIWLAALLGVGLGALLGLTAKPLAASLSSSDSVATLSTQYLQVAALSVPPMLLVLAATGALRGVLDLRTPLIAMIAANVVNVALTVWFVYGLGWGMRGAAAGLVIAQWFAAVWLIAAVVTRSRAAGSSNQLLPAEVLRAGAQGIPLLIRTLTLRAVLLIATFVAATLGDAPLAAHQIATTLVTFFAFALDALAIAGQTLTGHRLGASDVAGTRLTTNRMIQWGLGAGLIAGVLLAVNSGWIARLFTSDSEVHAVVVPALLVIAATQPISGIVFVLDGVLIGAGDGVFLAWAGLIVLLCYAPAAFAVGWFGASFMWLWVAYTVFIAARLITLWCRQRGETWLRLGIS